MNKPICSYCNDTGQSAIRSRDGAYAFPGPVPDDAKGYADADCWHCDSGRAPKPETIEQIKARKYECFIEDHEPKPWTPGQCAGYAGRGLHLMRCKRRDGYGTGGLFCNQHAKTGGF